MQVIYFFEFNIPSTSDGHHRERADARYMTNKVDTTFFSSVHFPVTEARRSTSQIECFLISAVSSLLMRENHPISAVAYAVV